MIREATGEEEANTIIGELESSHYNPVSMEHVFIDGAWRYSMVFALMAEKRTRPASAEIVPMPTEEVSNKDKH